jgi:hypothetical protein
MAALRVIDPQVSQFGLLSDPLSSQIELPSESSSPMNLPVQPDPEANRVFGESSHSLPPGSDPYFSFTQNIPSGPIGDLDEVPSSYVNHRVDTNIPQSDGTTDQDPAFKLLEEIDVRIYQLEDAANGRSEPPMPIRNAFRSDEPVEITQAPSTDRINSADTSGTTPCAPIEVVVQDASGHFIAQDNSVVFIDGDEGFDYIDLSDRDITHVTFGESTITVTDAVNNQTFTIRYRNIQQAMFANGQMIDLK